MLLNAAAILAALATGCAGMRLVYLALNQGEFSPAVWLGYGAALLTHLTLPALGVVVWRLRKSWWMALPLLSLTISAIGTVVLSWWLKRDFP